MNARKDNLLFGLLSLVSGVHFWYDVDYDQAFFQWHVVDHESHFWLPRVEWIIFTSSMDFPLSAAQIDLKVIERTEQHRLRYRKFSRPSLVRSEAPKGPSELCNLLFSQICYQEFWSNSSNRYQIFEAQQKLYNRAKRDYNGILSQAFQLFSFRLVST